MNNKKLFYKTVIALLLLLNGVCWLYSVETFFYDCYDDSYTCKIQEFTPPEGVQWATLDNHPLGSIIAMREHYHVTRSASHVLTEQEKEVIVQNKNALNMLYSVQMEGGCKFLNVYSMLAFNEKDLDFLFEQGLRPDLKIYIFYRPYVQEVQSLLFSAVVLGDANLVRGFLKQNIDQTEGIIVKDGKEIREKITPLTYCLNFNQIDQLADRNKKMAALLLAYGADIKQKKQELLQRSSKKTIKDINELFNSLFHDEKFKIYFKNEKEKSMNIELSKQVGVKPGVLSNYRLLQMKRLGARPEVRVPGFRY